MGCRDRQRQLQDFLTRDLPHDARMELRDHLKSCAVCRRDLEGYRLVMGALPGMPDPPVPAGLTARILAAIQPYHAAHKPERETLAAILVRRTVVCTLAFAFAVAFGAALWDWVLRIAQFAGRSISGDLLAFWDTAKDMWALLQLLAEVVDVLQPTAHNLIGVVQRVGSPLAIYGPLILTVYCGVLLLGTLLCLRAFSQRERGRLSHVS